MTAEATVSGNPLLALLRTPGSTPWSTWNPPARGSLDAEITAPPSQLETVLKNVLTFGGIGAAVGAIAGALALFGGGTVGALALTSAIGANVGTIFGVLEGTFLSGRDKRRYDAVVAERDRARAEADGAARPRVSVHPPKRRRPTTTTAES